MRRASLAILLVGLIATPAPAAGYVIVRPVEVRSAYPLPSYYCPAPFYPSFYPALPVFSTTPFVSPLALPRTAPASMPTATTSTEEVPLPVPRRPSVSVEPVPSPSTPSAPPAPSAARPGEPFYSVQPGPAGKDRADRRCSVAFWNLTGRPLSVRIAGKDHTLSTGRSLTLELPCVFAWQIEGREAEATRLPGGHPTAEVLIRR